VSLPSPRAQRTFTGSLEQLAHLRDFVNEHAAQYGCNEEDTFACELACDEAAANVFNHAFESKSGQIQVEMWREGDSVSVRMAYRGNVFDPSRIPTPDLDAPLDARPVGGLGLYFMRQLMTEVQFEFDAVNGNVLTMRRRLTLESRG
jgi:anti-sigma regulatory factor (Ser/Thr protein kinase)